MTFVFVTIHIDGMHCGACVRRIKAAFMQAPELDLSSAEVGKVQLTAEPFDDLEDRIRDLVKNVGFSVRHIQVGDGEVE